MTRAERVESARTEMFLDLHPTDPRWGHHDGPGADGVRLHYVRQGRGKPVLLLHGWPGFWYDYRRLVPDLAPHADVVAPDLRGFGYSDRPDLAPAEGYDVANHVDDLLALMDSLGLERPVIAGYDIGAVVAQALARRAPGRVAALALFNPSYGGIGQRRYEPAAQREFWYQHFHNLFWAPDLIGYNRETVRTYLGHFYDHWVAVKESVRPVEFEGIVDVYSRTGAIEASIQWYRARVAARAAEAAAAPATLAVTVPTVILWAELDPVFPVAWSDRLGEYFADLRAFRTLPGIGHFVPFEDPPAASAAIRLALSLA